MIYSLCKTYTPKTSQKCLNIERKKNIFCVYDEAVFVNEEEYICFFYSTADVVGLLYCHTIILMFQKAVGVFNSE